MPDKQGRPTLKELDEMPLSEVQIQRDVELAEWRALAKADLQIDGPTTGSREKYHDSLSRHYRLGYMRWLIDGSPEPQPNFL